MAIAQAAHEDAAHMKRFSGSTAHVESGLETKFMSEYKKPSESADAGRLQRTLENFFHSTRTAAHIEAMPMNHKDRPPYSASKFNKALPTPGSKRRPALEVQTIFSQDDERMPQQVYPTPSLSSRTQGNIASLNDIKALPLKVPSKTSRGVNGQLGSQAHLRQGPQKPVTGSLTQLDRVVKSARAPMDEAPPYVASNTGRIAVGGEQARFVLQDPPKAKRNNRLRRPPSLKLGSDISPSDRNIEIGLAVSSAAIKDHTNSLVSEASNRQISPRRQSSQGSCQSLKTPTIVVTPAEDDFEARLNTLPQELPQARAYRPRSSVYSRYTNCVPKRNQYDRTPPVPPLPTFAMESGSTAGSGQTMYSGLTKSKQISPPFSSSRHNDQTASICTTFNEDSPTDLASATSLQSKRLSSQSRLPTPRRSKGWWNVLVSPFSASSTSRTFFRSSSPVAKEDEQTTRLLKGNDLVRPPSSGPIFCSRSSGDSGLRSAPPTECSTQTFAISRVRTPKRSDTAPGALDLGNASAVNIYRTPSHGAASSYFDQKRSYPSLLAPVVSPGLDRAMEQDWSPSQSVYRESRSFSPPSLKIGDIGFGNVPIPTEGEAARYCDTTRQFPSMHEPGRGGSPAASRFESPAVTSGERPFVRSPIGGAFPQDNWRTGRNDNLKQLNRQTPDFQDGRVTPYSERDTLSMDSMHSGKYSREYELSPGEAAMTVDAGVYPSSFDNAPRSQPSGTCGADTYPSVRRFNGYVDDNASPPSHVTPIPNPKETTYANSRISSHRGMDVVTRDEVYSPDSEDLGMVQIAGTRPEDMHTRLSSHDHHYAGTTAPFADRLGEAHVDSARAPIGEQRFTGSLSPSQTSASTGETRPTLSVSSRDLAGPFDHNLSPQSPSPVLEHAQSTRYMGSPPSYGNVRELDFAPGQKKTGFDANLRTNAKNRFPTLDVDEDSGEEDLSDTPGPFNEKRAQGTLRSDRPQNRDLESSPRPARPWYRGILSLLASLGVLLLVLTIVLLAMFLPVHHADMPVEAQWLNLTGFPPLPTGVATVVGAKSVKDVASCVAREALWSCAAPRGERLSTTQPDQPNFRFLIRFRNGTISNETLVEPASNTTVRRDSGRTANAGALVKRSAWSSYLYTSSPPPPSTEDQLFLGRTTDGTSPPYDGEETPFYISLLNPIPIQPVKRSSLQKRGFRYPYPTPSHSVSDSSHSTSSNHSPTPIASDRAAAPIPPPAVEGSGEPAPPELYPYAYAQPLRLFNRGQRSEHYGFYTYFDRSIYVSGSVSDTSVNGSSAAGDSLSSNVRLDDASAVCTWSQSRLLVQIWTGKPDVTDLIPIANASSIPAVNSTANDMRSPGSFPYGVTITLDRHGGDVSKKGLYCYHLDENQHVLQSFGTWITENRSVGGKIVNPAGIPTNNGTLLTQGDVGRGVGIDGGSSGCSCQWQNFD